MLHAPHYSITHINLRTLVIIFILYNTHHCKEVFGNSSHAHTQVLHCTNNNKKTSKAFTVTPTSEIYWYTCTLLSWLYYSHPLGTGPGDCTVAHRWCVGEDAQSKHLKLHPLCGERLKHYHTHLDLTTLTDDVHTHTSHLQYKQIDRTDTYP